MIAIQTLGDGRIRLHDTTGQLPDVIVLPPVNGESQMLDPDTGLPVGELAMPDNGSLTELLKKSADGDSNLYIEKDMK